MLLPQPGTDESWRSAPQLFPLLCLHLFLFSLSHGPFLAENSSLRNLGLFINVLCSVTMAMLKESVMAKQDHKRIIFIFILSVSSNKQINKGCQQPESHLLLGKQLTRADSILLFFFCFVSSFHGVLVFPDISLEKTTPSGIFWILMIFFLLPLHC